jgi:geranylgeranylglycerol-phosphate geranylgeranyltransferase
MKIQYTYKNFPIEFSINLYLKHLWLLFSISAMLKSFYTVTTIMNRLEAWFRIIRPPIVFISVFGAAVGALNVTLSQGLYLEPFAFILSLFIAGILAAGLMVHNDYTDLESDRVNRPHKPLCIGVISPKVAKVTGIALMGLAVILSFCTTIFLKPNSAFIPWGLNFPCGFLTLIIMLVGVIYNRNGKYVGLMGHIMVAFGVGAIPYWGAISVKPTDLLSMLPLALAIGIMEVGREIMVCAGDIKGDIKAGYRTTPVRLGRLKSMLVAVGFYIISIPIFFIPYYGYWLFPKIFGELYFWGVIMFELILIFTWLDTYRVAIAGDDSATWRAFERNIRTGTRVGVILFQVILMFEAFY